MEQKVNHTMYKLSSEFDAERCTAVAAVLSNWHNVLRAINMASCKSAEFTHGQVGLYTKILKVKVPKPSPGEDDANAISKPETEVPLPQTLVRIPVEQADFVQPQDSGGKRNEA